MPRFHTSTAGRFLIILSLGGKLQASINRTSSNNPDKDIDYSFVPFVSYPGVGNLKRGQIIFTFTLRANSGSVITVTPPMGYMLTCSSEGALKQLSLPGDIFDCIDDPFELALTSTLTAGEYAFGAVVDVPPEIEQSQNTFSIKIKSQDNQVINEAFGVPGQVVVNDVQVSNPTLSCGKSDLDARAIITFGLTFDDPTTRIKALLLNFPRTFILDVHRPTEVVNLNDRLKLASVNWADTQFTDRLRIYLDDSGLTTAILTGTYEFKLPVRVPEHMPHINVWYLSLCEDRGCSQPGDNGIVVTLPMAGFALSEFSPEVAKAAADDSRQLLLHICARICMFVALFAPLALSQSGC